jgi:hypothetical protein
LPSYKQRVVFELARNIKAFLTLDAGVTRGLVPDPEQLAVQVRQLLGQAAVKDSQIHGLSEQVSIMREQLETGGREISRLQQLTHKQSRERQQKIAQLNRQQLEAVSESEEDGMNGRQGALSNEPATVLYLDLIKRCLKNAIYADELAGEGTWPAVAHTMIGFDSLDNVKYCVEDVIANDVPGDIIETGVWRGGTTIFMRAILKAHGVGDRTVWVADSFEGLPPPDEQTYPHDAGDISHTAKELAISLERVQANFEKYGLLDGQVKFLKGWFKDTLPEAPIDKLAVVRLDGDMYESTMDGLINLYPKLSVGGYLIVDDYGAVPACRQAVHDYRDKHGIEDEIKSIDWTGVYWQRTV